MRYIDLVVFLLLITVMISPVAASNINPDARIFSTWIEVSGNPLDYHDGVFTVHTKDTSRKHDLKAKVMYKPFEGSIRTLNGFKHFFIGESGFNLYFECWEKPGQDNNGNGVCGELLYTEKDHTYFNSEAEVTPAKWYEHGVPTGEYNIQIKFKELCASPDIFGNRLYYASQVTIPFCLLK